CLKNGLLPTVDQVGGRPTQQYVANGDIGRVRGFRGKQMLVELRSPRRLVAVPLGKGGEEEQARADDETSEERRAGKGELAYCCTCHKYQGSECPVVIVLVEGAGKLGSREWIYTAISRARELCVIVGERDDLKRYVRNVTLPDRRTFLVPLITGEMAL